MLKRSQSIKEFLWDERIRRLSLNNSIFEPAEGSDKTKDLKPFYKEN